MTKSEHKRKAGRPIALENAARILWLRKSWGAPPGALDEEPDSPISDVPKYEAAIQNPTGDYDHPSAVVQDEALGKPEKREILESWAAEASHLQESEAEGFDGGETSLLTEINSALQALADAEKSNTHTEADAASLFEKSLYRWIA